MKSLTVILSLVCIVMACDKEQRGKATSKPKKAYTGYPDAPEPYIQVPNGFFKVSYDKKDAWEHIFVVKVHNPLKKLIVVSVACVFRQDRPDASPTTYTISNFRVFRRHSMDLDFQHWPRKDPADHKVYLPDCKMKSWYAK